MSAHSGDGADRHHSQPAAHTTALLLLLSCSSNELLGSAVLPGLVHALCVIGNTVWACTGDGKIALYDTNTGDVKVKVGRLSGGGAARARRPIVPAAHVSS